MQVDSDMSQKLPEDFYENYGKKWSDSSRREIERLDTIHKIDRMIAIFGDFKPKSILDIGCGLGDAMSLMSQYYTEAEVTAIDPSSSMLEAARNEHPHLTFSQKGVDDISEFDVDLITFFDVLEHVDDIPSILARVRASSNYMAFKIPLEKTWLIELLNILRLKKRQSLAFESEGHLYEFNRKEVIQLVLDAGFEVIATSTHFVMKEEMMFGDLITNRMKKKTDIVGRTKYYAYRLLSLLPFRLVEIVIRPFLGDDFYMFCKAPKEQNPSKS